MNPIELGKAIAEVGIPIITAVMLILVVGLVWYLIRRQTRREDKHNAIQKEERLFHRKLIENDLTAIHNISLENSKLNNQSLLLQQEMMKEIKEHDGQSRDAWNKLNGSLGAICERLNNKTPVKDNKKNKIGK